MEEINDLSQLTVHAKYLILLGLGVKCFSDGCHVSYESVEDHLCETNTIIMEKCCMKPKLG